MQKSTNEQMGGRVSHALCPVLCPSCGLRQTVTPASRSDVCCNRTLPQSTSARSDFGLSAAELYGTPLSPSELALSYPREFGEFA